MAVNTEVLRTIAPQVVHTSGALCRGGIAERIAGGPQPWAKSVAIPVEEPLLVAFAPARVADHLGELVAPDDALVSLRKARAAFLIEDHDVVAQGRISLAAAEHRDGIG